jgi:hypothetical protein
MALLRRNARLFDTAYAVVNEDGHDLILLRSAQAAGWATASDIAAVIESIARQADQVESKLIADDTF